MVWGSSNNQIYGVGQKKPNGFGLYDMNGNVWESWSGNYQPSPLENPIGLSTGYYRVRRGGGWNTVSRNMSVTARGWNLQFYRSPHQGFRLTRTVL